MVETWICRSCVEDGAGKGKEETTRRMDTLCDVCEEDRVYCTCYVSSATTEPPKPPACGDCRFYVGETTGPKDNPRPAGFGRCHRLPPVWMGEDRGNNFVFVDNIDWCGEFQPNQSLEFERLANNPPRIIPPA